MPCLEPLPASQAGQGSAAGTCRTGTSGAAPVAAAAGGLKGQQQKLLGTELQRELQSSVCTIQPVQTPHSFTEYGIQNVNAESCWLKKDTKHPANVRSTE